MKEDKVIQITEAISKLDESDKYRLFVGLFFKKIVSFHEVSEHYVKSLELLEKEQSILINGLANSLSMWWCKRKKTGGNKEFRTNKTAYTLIKSGVFKSTVIEKEFIKRIEESGYSEDENGFPISTSKKKEEK